MRQTESPQSAPTSRPHPLRLPAAASRLNYSSRCDTLVAFSLFLSFIFFPFLFSPLPEPPSNQVVVLQVALQDVVLHRVEDKSNVVCVRGAGEVRVDDFFRVGVEADKHVQNEFGPRVGVLLWAWREEGREGEAE